MSDAGSEDIPLNNVHVSGSSGVQNPGAEGMTPVTMPGESPMSSPTPPTDDGSRSATPQSHQNPQYQQNPYQQGAPPNPYQQGNPQNPYKQGPSQNPYQPGAPPNPYRQPGQAPNPYQQGGAPPPNPYQPGQPQQGPPASYQPQQASELTHRGHPGGPPPQSSRIEAEEEEEEVYDESGQQFGPIGWTILTICIILTFPFSILCFVKILLVKEYERVVIQRLGRMLGAKGPGIVVVFPCIEQFNVVGLRTIAMDVPPQVILTKDSVSVNVDAVVYYRVVNARKCVQNIENAHYSTSLVAQTTLRNLLGTRSMAGILAERDDISREMLVELDLATEPWGIKVERVEVKDVRIPYQLQRAMAAEAEASREAKAQMIHAQAEKNASAKLKEAADVIASSPAAMQIRFLQTMSSVSVEKDTTIIFPLPIDILPPGYLKQFQKRKMK